MEIKEWKYEKYPSFDEYVDRAVRNVVLSVRISSQIFLQIITTIQYTKMEYNWWIWYICKDSYKEK